MSWLSNLFGGKPAPAPTPPPNTVVIEAGMATLLTAEGAALEPAVNAALREYADAKSREEATAEAHGIPFWLRRDSERAGDIEDELRDRVIRRSGEESSP